MNGTCQCGGRIVERTHTVTTDRGAMEYGVDTFPVDIEVSQCKACGRAMTKVYSIDGLIVERNSNDWNI